MFFLQHEILGINARNLKYLKTPKRIRKILDSKLLTKKVLKENDLPVFDTLDIVKTRKELLNFNWEALPGSFVLKPNRGFGGEGIVVVYGMKKKVKEPTWIRADGTFLTKREIENHVFDILEGKFSLFSLPDVAFFEERAKIIKELKPYSFRGIPDVRIIVYQKVPVMAMLRLPTEESGGRANLHLGGVGVGTDLAGGITTNALSHGKFIDYYPGTRYLLRGIKIPYFKKILSLAVEAQIAIGVSFTGVDIAVDKEKGPVVLELNTRPGLQIQLTNLAGLKERLERIRGLRLESKERGIRLAQDLFGGLEEEPEEIFGKKILGTVEEVDILSPPLSYKTLAKIDTGSWRSSISSEIAKELKLEESVIKVKVKSSFGEELRSIVPLSFKIKGEKIDTEVNLADRSQMKYEMIIGRKDLKKFLVDPSKIRAK